MAARFCVNIMTKYANNGTRYTKQLLRELLPGITHNASCLHTSSVTLSNIGDVVKSYNRKWLRENCRCTTCFNHDTEQRNVVFSDLKPAQLEIESIQQSPEYDAVRIKWQDSHVSDVSLDWLKKHSFPGQRMFEKKLWDGSLMSQERLDVISGDELLRDEDGVKRLLTSLLTYGISIVQHVGTSISDTQQVAERICFIQETLYGRMWTFTSDLSRADTAYTNLALGAHTDSTYLSTPTGLQIFHCMEHTGDGGRTLLVDGFHSAHRLREDNPEHFDTLCQFRIHHENKDGDNHYLRSLDPVLKVDPVSGDLEMIRYNHYDRAPISTIPQADMERYYDALGKLTAYINDPGAAFWIKLRPGMVLFIDNWRVLHGRESFTGLRRVCGCYLPRDDWIGKARVLGIIP